MSEGSMGVSGGPESGLHRGTLDEARVFGQSVAGVGPTLGAVALIPITFASAGNAGWLTVVVGCLGILAVAGSITIMARRQATAGALYHLNAQGLGRWAGFLTGVSLIGLVTLILPFVTLGFAQAVSQLSDSMGFGAFSPFAMFATEIACIVVAALLANREIKFSTTLFLILELVSVALILILLVVVLAHSHTFFDKSLFSFKGASVHGVLTGVVIIVLAFVGFEGSTSLGLESRNPARAIPIALIGAVVTIGIFFTVNAYIQTLGFLNLHLDLGAAAAPVDQLAHSYHVSALGDLILLGVAASWFAALISWLVYGPRVLMTMAGEGVVPAVFTRTSKKHGSPYVAIGIWLAICTAVDVWVYAAGYSSADVFAALSSFVGYCATLYYLLAGAAVVGWAHRRRAMTPMILMLGAATVIIMAIAFYFSFVPLPPAPVRGFVYLFGAMVLASLVTYGLLKRFAPTVVARIGTSTEELSSSLEYAMEAP